ncbi:MAG: c-type cytochrome [Dehalococcoidia bacterium]|nr:c-type cytochrome [Dehalococcoidia bacterium]
MSAGSGPEGLIGALALLLGFALLGAAWWGPDSFALVVSRARLARLVATPPENRSRFGKQGTAFMSVLGAIVMVVGLYLLLGQLVVDASASKWLRNPVSSTAQSRAIGKDIYGQLCLDCHGPDGAGDGSTAMEFSADMDLSAHVLAHPSGELFAWISSGIGDDMPYFEDLLTDEQRWHVVNYIRTFGDFSLFTSHGH